MLHNRKSILWIAVVLAGLFSITAAAVSRRGWGPEKAVADVTKPEADSRSEPTTGDKKERLGYELVTLTRFGFEPTQITRRGGHFFLAIENRSAAGSLTIRIDPEHGNRILEITQPPDQMDWVDEMRLPPGRYQISTADQPDRVCQLTITP
jgi:hypothetical protein